MSRESGSGWRLVGAGLLGAWLVLVGSQMNPPAAHAQVDTPVAAEARRLLREVRDRNGSLADWNSTTRAPNLADVQYELSVGERGDPAALRTAAVNLRSGSGVRVVTPSVQRLAQLLEVRADELTPLAREAWSDECRAMAQRYEPVTLQRVSAARRAWQRALDRLEPAVPAVRTRGSAWGKFLFWPESRALASTEPSVSPIALESLDRLEARWAAAPSVWDDDRLVEASLAARTYIRLLRGYVTQESADQHAAAWNELADHLDALPAEGVADTTAVGRAVNQRERLGQASRLTSSIRRTLSQPNLILQVDRSWLESQFARRISDAYRVDNVFAGTRSIGNGQIQGTMRVELQPSTAVGRLLLRFTGTSTARTRGTQDQVRVVSRATTRVTGTKPLWLDARGLTAEPAQAGADTNIVYESINSPGLGPRRRRAANETYARRPRAERDSERYAQQSIEERIDAESRQLIDRFNSRYRTDFRDPRITQFRPAPAVRVQTGDRQLRWECLLEGRESFGAPASPPAIAAGSRLVLNVAASAIEELVEVELAKNGGSLERLFQELGQPAQPSDASSAEPFQITLDEDPLAVRCEDGLLHVQLSLTQFVAGTTTYPSMTVDVAFQPAVQDGRLVFLRTEDLRVTPHADGQDGSEKLSGRQQTLRLAAQRKLARWLPTVLEGAGIRLPFLGDEATEIQVESTQTNQGWLQLALAPPRRGDL